MVPADNNPIDLENDELLFTTLGTQIAQAVIEIEDVSAVMSTTHQYIDMALAAIKQHKPELDAKLACRQGCSHCCYLPVETTSQVIADIAQHVQSRFDHKQKEQLINKLQVDKILRKKPLFRAPCPLLDESGSCSVYEKRPLVCRSFTSTDVEACKKSVLDGSSVAQQPLRFKVYQAATVALQATLVKQQKNHEQVPLVSSLLAELLG